MNNKQKLPINDHLQPKLGYVFKIAFPIIISNASHTVMLFVDRLFLSRLGKQELAAAMSGGLSSHVLCSFFVGLIGYVSALVAQYYGAKKPRMCGIAIIQAFYLGIISYPILICFIPIIKYGFIFAKQEPLLTDLASTYARTLLAGSIFLIIRTAAGSFFVGIGKTKIVMIANLTAALVNIPLNYVLIFGKFGFPAMAIQGAALGTVFASGISCIILLGSYLKEISQFPYRTKNLLKIRVPIIKRLLLFGLPAGISPFLNWFAFNVFVQLMHSYGPNTAAAATIAFNWDTVVFLPMLGLGITARTVVGQSIGAKDLDGAQRLTYLIMRISIIYAIAMMTLFIGLTNPLTSVFVSGLQDTGGEIQNMANIMLRLLALYTLANSCKLVLGGALRAAGDTTWTMWVSITIHWAMAISVVILVHFLEVNQYIAWSTLIIMNNIDFISLIYRFRTNNWREIKLIS
tara:strand:- start:466 stop:1845 length:1380 start_codon:yes stop_codon:yes gene_type:complete